MKNVSEVRGEDATPFTLRDITGFDTQHGRNFLEFFAYDAYHPLRLVPLEVLRWPSSTDLAPDDEEGVTIEVLFPDELSSHPEFQYHTVVVFDGEIGNDRGVAADETPPDFESFATGTVQYSTIFENLVKGTSIEDITHFVPCLRRGGESAFVECFPHSSVTPLESLLGAFSWGPDCDTASVSVEGDVASASGCLRMSGDRNSIVTRTTNHLSVTGAPYAWTSRARVWHIFNYWFPLRSGQRVVCQAVTGVSGDVSLGWSEIVIADFATGAVVVEAFGNNEPMLEVTATFEDFPGADADDEITVIISGQGTGRIRSSTPGDGSVEWEFSCEVR